MEKEQNTNNKDDEQMVTKSDNVKKKKQTGTVKSKSVTLKASGNSLTGKPLDNIELNPQLGSDRQVAEQSRGGVVLTFGRMNPPTVGHEKLVNKVKDVARSKRATPLVYLSHSQDKKKNPLEYADKVRFARAAFGNVVQAANQRTLIDILKTIQNKFSELTLVVGSDRVKEFDNLLQKYNGKDYSFDKIDVVSAGERDPDSEGVSGMSASKMRDAAAGGDERKFASGLPKGLKSPNQAKSIYSLTRIGMQLHEELESADLLSEALDIQQRRKRALIMRRYAPKIKRARELAKRKLAPESRLKKRAYKQARAIVRKRVAGKRGQNYANLSPAEKIQVDLAVDKRKKIIGKIAKRIMPKVKQAEFQRLKSFMKGQQMEPAHSTPKNESAELNAMFEQYAQNVDITTVDDILEEMTNLVLDKMITEKQIASLEKRANRTGIDYDLLEQVYVRGLLDTMGDQHAAFNRVNAFTAGGKSAMNEDYDLYQQIDELSRKTLDSYKNKAFSQYMDATHGPTDWNKQSDKVRDKAAQRMHGMNMADRKLGKSVYKAKVTATEETVDEARAPNKPYVKPHDGGRAWKASDKWGKVRYFGGDFKKSAEKHAFKEDKNAQNAAIAISKQKSGKYDADGKRTKPYADGRSASSHKFKKWESVELEEHEGLSKADRIAAHRRLKSQHAKAGDERLVKMYDRKIKKDINESLRNWFDKDHPKGDWVRIGTDGKIKGDCAREEGEGKPKCLPRDKAHSMSKEDRAKAARRKRRQDPETDRPGTGNKPINVKTEEYIEEKAQPSNPQLWSRAKSLARQKFDVYPSAYANGWAAKWYKSKGGGWKNVSEEVAIPDDINKKLQKVVKQLNKSVKSHGKQRDLLKGLLAKDKKDVNEGKNHSWRSTGHYTIDGKEWLGDQHAYEGQVMTGKEHGPDSQRLYHFKDLPTSVRQKIQAKINESLNTDHYKALTDIKLNTKNRDMTTKEDGYGPLNPDDKNGSKPFWEEKAKKWNTTVEAAQQSLCGNCAAFNQSKEVLDKIAEGLGPEGDKINDLAGLGFCELWEFKCAAARTCDTWIHGGPITEDLNLAFEELSQATKDRKEIDSVPRKKQERNKVARVSRPRHNRDDDEMSRQGHVVNTIGEEGNVQPRASKRLQGTDELVKTLKADTPGEGKTLDESFNMAISAGIGITLTAADLGMKAQGGFALHPSVIEDEDETDEDV
jgi:hypothetical protein